MSLRLALPALRAAVPARAATRQLAPHARFSTSRATSTTVAATAGAGAGIPAAATFKAGSGGAGAGGAGAGARSGPSFGRKWGTRLALVLAIPVAFLAGAVYPPQLVLIFNPRYSPPPPSSDTKHGKALMEETERELQDLFIVARMRNKEGWYETRPYQRFDPNKIHNSLTAGSLRGPGKLAVPPIAFAKADETEAVIVLHLGRALCGHDGIVHGGLLATVFDETLARNALMNIPSHIGVTANLNLNYRSPCMADQFVVVRTKLENKKGRKVNVSGYMETLDGERIAEANALFIEPKWAQFLQSSGVTEALGAPAPVVTAAIVDEHQV